MATLKVLRQSHPEIIESATLRLIDEGLPAESVRFAANSLTNDISIRPVAMNPEDGLTYDLDQLGVDVKFLAAVLLQYATLTAPPDNFQDDAACIAALERSVEKACQTFNTLEDPLPWQLSYSETRLFLDSKVSGLPNASISLQQALNLLADPEEHVRVMKELASETPGQSPPSSAAEDTPH